MALVMRDCVYLVRMLSYFSIGREKKNNPFSELVRFFFQ